MTRQYCGFGAKRSTLRSGGCLGANRGFVGTVMGLDVHTGRMPVQSEHKHSDGKGLSSNMSRAEMGLRRILFAIFLTTVLVRETKDMMIGLWCHRLLYRRGVKRGSWFVSFFFLPPGDVLNDRVIFGTLIDGRVSARVNGGPITLRSKLVDLF
jgi:hypothetical protein